METCETVVKLAKATYRLGDDIAAFLYDDDFFDGDISPAVKRLRDEEVELTMRERVYLADLLEGKIKRPAHRGASRKLLYKQLQIARYFLYLTEALGLKSESAVQYAAPQFNRSESSVWKDIASAKKHYGAAKWNVLKSSHLYERGLVRETERRLGRALWSEAPSPRKRSKTKPAKKS